MIEFQYASYAQDVIFGAGALGRLSEAVDRAGWRRLMLCANRSMRAGGHLEPVEHALGGRLVAVLDQVRPHVQDVQVAEALKSAAGTEVDAVIGMGGGSPIGLAKAVAFELGRSGPGARSRVGIVAVPGTYAGSEMTAVYGITHTDETPPRKVTVSDPAIAPGLVIYDPLLTLDLPPDLTGSTGINALAHCLEALYSTTRHPLSSAAAIEGVRRIAGALLRCYEHGSELEARTEMLAGAHLAGLSLAGVKMGLHHGLCHVLGGSAGLPHGVANSIILPHALRFNAASTAAQLLPAAEALGVSTSGRAPVAVVETAADRISGMIRAMNLPQRLRDTGVAESDLPRLAELAFKNATVQSNPQPIGDAGQIEKLLRAAW